MTKNISNKSIEETLEYNIIIRMPPRKRYNIELKVKSIKRAEPRVVEPDRRLNG